MKFSAFILLVLTSSAALAQSCPEPLEPSAVAVKSLIEQASSMKTMDDFLSRLPKSMTSNFIFLGESRSFQNADVQDPRVILASPNGDVRLSFNTNPSQRGYNNIEISMWNPEKKEFEYQELTFSKNGQKAPDHNDGLSCKLCHGENSKPNWDANNFWPGAIPFNKDTLVRGTAELGWYTDLIAKTKVKTPGNRLQFLTPIEDTAAISQAMAQKPYMTRKIMTDTGVVTDGAGGIGTRMFNKLQERQRCSQQSQIEKNPLFDKFKYLMAGLQNNCAMEKFIPEWFDETSGDFFYGSIPNFPKPGTRGSNFQNLIDSTAAAQASHSKDKAARQIKFMNMSITNSDAGLVTAQNEFDKNKSVIGLNTKKFETGEKSTFDENSREVAKYRYFLEPFGVMVSNFSTSVDPTSYSFGDSFKGEYLAPAAKTKIEAEAKSKGGNLCDSLANLSRNAIDSDGVRSTMTEAAQLMCNQRDENEAGIVKVEEMGANVIQAQAADAFNKKCASCHSAQTAINIGYTVGGAPVIPFKSIQSLKYAVTSNQGKLTGLGDRILSRINRPHNFPGSMPLNGLVDLKDDERIYMNAWIRSQVGR